MTDERPRIEGVDVLIERSGGETKPGGRAAHPGAGVKDNGKTHCDTRLFMLSRYQLNRGCQPVTIATRTSPSGSGRCSPTTAGLYWRVPTARRTPVSLTYRAAAPTEDSRYRSAVAFSASARGTAVSPFYAATDDVRDRPVKGSPRSIGRRRMRWTSLRPPLIPFGERRSVDSATRRRRSIAERAATPPARARP